MPTGFALSLWVEPVSGIILEISSQNSVSKSAFVGTSVEPSLLSALIDDSIRPD
jgi:hypothetical protein